MKDSTKGSPTLGENISVPATVIECPPMVAVGVRAYKMTPNGFAVITEAWVDKLPKDVKVKRTDRKSKKKDYEKASASTQIAKMKKEMDSVEFVRLLVATQPKLAGFPKKSSDVFEVELAGKTAEASIDFAKDNLGKEIKMEEVLREGEVIDTIAITKGHGTVGPVKRFGVVIQGPGAKGKRRHVGSLGQESPGKVRWTVPMAGQKGFQQRTEYNKRILKMNGGENAGKEITPKKGFPHYGTIKGPYIILKGSVQGPRKRMVFMRLPIRPIRIGYTVPEISEIVR